MIFGTVCFVLHAKADHLGFKIAKAKTQNNANETPKQNKTKFSNEADGPCSPIRSLIGCMSSWRPWGVRRQ